MSLARVLLGVLTLFVLPIALQEFHACCPWLANKLVEWAAARLPEPDQMLYEAEWKAELASVPGNVVRLLRAIGFIVAAFRMRRPLRDPRQDEVRRRTDFQVSLRLTVEIHGSATIRVRGTAALAAVLVLVIAFASAQLWLASAPKPNQRSGGLAVCAGSLAVRDQPASTSAGARLTGFAHRGDRFLVKEVSGPWAFGETSGPLALRGWAATRYLCSM